MNAKFSVLFFSILFLNCSLQSMQNANEQTECDDLKKQINAAKSERKNLCEEHKKKIAQIEVTEGRPLAGLSLFIGTICGLASIGCYDEIRHNKYTVFPMIGTGLLSSFFIGYGLDGLFAAVYQDPKNQEYHRLGFFSRLKNWAFRGNFKKS